MGIEKLLIPTCLLVPYVAEKIFLVRSFTPACLLANKTHRSNHKYYHLEEYLLLGRPNNIIYTMNFINIVAIISVLVVQTAKAESAAAHASLDLERNLNLNETLTNSTATADPETETPATMPEFPSDATADGFSLIDGEFSTVESVTISPLCPWDTKTFYPNAVFTIQPSTSAAYVSSFPANLVTPTVSGGELQIEWNAAVANGAKSGGVRIGLPTDQFKKLSIKSLVTAQVIGGFTSVQSLEVDSASTLKARLTSNEISDLAVSADGASTVDVRSSSSIASVEAQGASTVRVYPVNGSVSGSLTVEGTSTLYIDGNFGGSGTIDGASTVEITDEMSGVLENSGTSTINANIITGVIDNSGASTVNAWSCENVNSADISSCNRSGPPARGRVDIPPLFDAVSTSSCSCSGFSKTCSNDFWNSNSGTSLGSSISFAVAAVAGTTTMVAFLFI